MDALDLDANFEPLSRARSNTWPLPRPEYYVEKDTDDKGVDVPATIQESGDAGSQQQPAKKNSSRRNAWGNKSYADLITQAIQSSQDRRLTLSQIYDWMVQNVAYFKDKGDSNSSAGWKNSIRHNLSLHNRFMRVQNEGTGKSSWWMVNPDAKPGKAARRRATSMETPKYERKRTKAKEAKAKALRLQQQQQQAQQQQQQQGGVTPSPSSSVSEGLDMFPDSPHTAFQLSPETFRPRASSNASSCGRLSPIPAVEGDLLQDSNSQQMPPLSPIPWSTYARPSSNSVVDRYVADQLVDSLTVAMKLGGGDNGYLENPSPSPPAPAQPPAPSTPTPQVRIKSEYPPPPANVQIKSEFPQLPVLIKSEYSPVATPQGVRIKQEYQPPTSIQMKSEYPQSNVRIKSEYPLFDTSYVDRHQDFGYQSQPSSPTTTGTLGVPSPGSQSCTSPPQDHFQPALPKMVASAEAYRYLLQQQQHQHQLTQDRANSKDPQTGLNSSAQLMMGHLTFNNTLPYDLDLNTLQGGLECDVDQVIRHELSVDGELDFNFDPMAAAAAAAAHTNSMNSRPWVH